MRKNKPNEDGSWHWYNINDLIQQNFEPSTVFYLYNDVISATPKNEVIRISLIRSIILIEDAKRDNSCIRAHTVTGPTNVSVAAAIHILRSALTRSGTARFQIFDRTNCLKGKEYEYKRDIRNWQIAGA